MQVERIVIDRIRDGADGSHSGEGHVKSSQDLGFAFKPTNGGMLVAMKVP